MSNSPKRPYNFGPGPATLPESVLLQAQAELLDYRGCGMSVMEMSHRGKHFMEIYAELLQDFRELLALPPSHKLLFMQGGAIGQNAIVPMNLSRAGVVDFVLTGAWSKKSAAEAAKFCTAHIAADALSAGAYNHIPDPTGWKLTPGASYLHLCTNETVHGVEFEDFPDVGAPLVVDISSHVLSRPMDFSRVACAFGGAQKNLSIAGLTFVAVREDLLDHALPMCPSAFDYRTVEQNDSMFNTPPTYAMYLAGLVFKWIKAQGGVAAMGQINAQKSALLYKTIDESRLYKARVVPGARSKMNVCFDLTDEALNAAFLSQAQDAGLINIKGHKSVGGMRASIYNAMPLAGVERLVAFMQDFEKRA